MSLTPPAPSAPPAQRGPASRPVRRNPGAAFAPVTEEALLDIAAVQGLVLDAQQRAAVTALASRPRRGVYLHGSVGRGKSWLADAVLRLVAERGRRLHMHEFLGALGRTMASERLPLPEAVLRLAGDAELLVLDEFHVHDIADAIMLRRTLTTLLETDLALLMTSNYPPARLLPDPTYHEAMLPAIRAIESALDVVHLDGSHDYRADSKHLGGFASGTWSVEPPAHAAAGSGTLPVALGPTRTLQALTTESGGLVVGWEELCVVPRSVGDYLTLARAYPRLELRGVPRPEDIDPEAFQRLAYLLDVFVDADIPLDVTAAVPREAFSLAAGLPRDAERLLSRLSLLADAAA